MSWRTVVISSRSKLDYKMNYLVIRSEEDTKRIFLDEIALLMLENTAISITGCLLTELIARKIRVVLCDGKRNPCAELTPYYGCHDTTQKIRSQIKWTDDNKGAVWTAIISEKIKRQAKLLLSYKLEEQAAMLLGYLSQVEFYDTTNREGHAAKVYFNALFGKGFSRGDGSDCINSALNYGYGLILSAFNREIASCGYITQLGLFHDNMFNPFNLSCDLMEPIRILVDKEVKDSNFTKFDSQEKHAMVGLLHRYVTIDGGNQTVLNAIKLYTRSVFNAIADSDVSKIKFIDYEL